MTFHTTFIFANTHASIAQHLFASSRVHKLMLSLPRYNKIEFYKFYKFLFHLFIHIHLQQVSTRLYKKPPSIGLCGLKLKTVSASDNLITDSGTYLYNIGVA
jgi:hypothetical protein